MSAQIREQGTILVRTSVLLLALSATGCATTDSFVLEDKTYKAQRSATRPRLYTTEQPVEVYHSVGIIELRRPEGTPIASMAEEVIEAGARFGCDLVVADSLPRPSAYADELEDALRLVHDDAPPRERVQVPQASRAEMTTREVVFRFHCGKLGPALTPV